MCCVYCAANYSLALVWYGAQYGRECAQGVRDYKFKTSLSDS